MTRLADAFLSGFRWYRRLRCSHWERWWIDGPVNAFSWTRLASCSVGGERPGILCRGTPTCEDWPA